jgi:hypothetical protein
VLDDDIARVDRRVGDKYGSAEARGAGIDLPDRIGRPDVSSSFRGTHERNVSNTACVANTRPSAFGQSTVDDRPPLDRTRAPSNRAAFERHACQGSDQ